MVTIGVIDDDLGVDAASVDADIIAVEACQTVNNMDIVLYLSA